MIKNIFTWWEGASWGTTFATFLRGERVGSDGLGNIYYTSKKVENGRKRRWVIYAGANDASRVPPDWHGWLHGTFDALPEVALPAPRNWEQLATPNLTGTTAAYRPAGALEEGGRRAAASGDYQAWSPDVS